MLHDYLRENSWTYRETLEEGRIEGIRQSVEALMRSRFPDLLAPVKGLMERQSDLTRLEEMLVIVGTARTAEEVEQYLLALQ